MKSYFTLFLCPILNPAFNNYLVKKIYKNIEVYFFGIFNRPVTIMTEKRKSQYKPAPISDEVYEALEKKYGVAQEELRRIAKEMRFGKPKLEMYLIVLTNEAKKR